MFISELKVGPLKQFICCCHLLAEICEKWQFSTKIKKKYRLHRGRVQLPEWSMGVIWRLGTELRHFDQEIWGGNNCDMVVFTIDERRVEVVFFFALCLHRAFYSKQFLTKPPSLWDASYPGFNQTWIFKKKEKDVLISSLFFTARLRLNFIDTDSSFHVRKFHVMDSFLNMPSLLLINFTMESTMCQPKVSRPLHLPSCSIRHGWLYSMDCQSRVKPGFTSVITIVWIYTASALFQTSRLVADRRDFGCWALLYGASTAFINDAGDTIFSLAKTDRGRIEGPLNWTAPWVIL